MFSIIIIWKASRSNYLETSDGLRTGASPPKLPRRLLPCFTWWWWWTPPLLAEIPSSLSNRRSVMQWTTSAAMLFRRSRPDTTGTVRFIVHMLYHCTGAVFSNQHFRHAQMMEPVSMVAGGTLMIRPCYHFFTTLAVGVHCGCCWWHAILEGQFTCFFGCKGPIVLALEWMMDWNAKRCNLLLYASWRTTERIDVVCSAWIDTITDGGKSFEGYFPTELQFGSLPSKGM